MKNQIFKFFPLFLALFLLIHCSEPRKTEYSTSGEKVFLVITNGTTKDELTKIAADFKTERNIDLNFLNTEFSEEGKIKILNFSVNCNDGYRGDATSTAAILETKNSGFSRDYRKNAEKPFIMGDE